MILLYITLSILLYGLYKRINNQHKSQPTYPLPNSEETGSLRLKYTRVCAEQLAEKERLLIFPSNLNMHHENGTHSLFCNWGGGLAGAAQDYTKAYQYTLGVPTQAGAPESIDPLLESNPHLYRTMQGSILQIWYLLGAGFTLSLPVRKHHNQDYFKKALCNIKLNEENITVEPSLGGGINQHKSPKCFKFYLKCFKQILKAQKQSFDDTHLSQLKLPTIDSLKSIDKKPYDAFKEGKKAASLNMPFSLIDFSSPSLKS